MFWAVALLSIPAVSLADRERGAAVSDRTATVVQHSGRIVGARRGDGDAGTSGGSRPEALSYTSMKALTKELRSTAAGMNKEIAGGLTAHAKAAVKAGEVYDALLKEQYAAQVGFSTGVKAFRTAVSDLHHGKTESVRKALGSGGSGAAASTEAGQTASKDAGEAASKDAGEATSKDAGDSKPEDAAGTAPKETGDAPPKDAGEATPKDAGESMLTTINEVDLLKHASRQEEREAETGKIEQAAKKLEHDFDDKALHVILRWEKDVDLDLHLNAPGSKDTVTAFIQKPTGDAGENFAVRASTNGEKVDGWHLEDIASAPGRRLPRGRYHAWVTYASGVPGASPMAPTSDDFEHVPFEAEFKFGQEKKLVKDTLTWKKGQHFNKAKNSMALFDFAMNDDNVIEWTNGRQGHSGSLHAETV